ncbi:MAG: hypothetical protein R8G66_30150 [Cytophagales bacterium]|nr:hypothetical protein [Cytophagales bacterium]
MRRLHLTLAICCSILVGSVAQEITVSTDTLNERAPNQKYQYQTLDQYDQRILLKLGALGGFGFSFNNQLRDLPFDFIGLEYRLTPLISVEGAYFFRANNLSGYSLKLRHYLKKGRLADNMSGRYVAVEFGNRFIGSTSTNQTYQLQLGQQIKKSRFGYADFSVFSSYQVTSFDNYLNFGLNVTVGAAWGPTGNRSQLKLPSEHQFSGHREHFLITLENPSFVLGENFQSFSLTSTVEKELLIKGLTARTTFSAGYSRQTSISAENFFARSYAFSVSASIRKYIGRLRKPSVDRPLHSFSGLYLGTGVGSMYSLADVKFSSTAEVFKESRYGFDRAIPFISIGYQERLGKRFFYDIFATYSFYTYTNFIHNHKGDPYLSFGTRVGLNWGR